MGLGKGKIGRIRIEKSEEKRKTKTFPKEGKAQFSQEVASRQRSS